MLLVVKSCHTTVSVQQENKCKVHAKLLEGTLQKQADVRADLNTKTFKLQ